MPATLNVLRIIDGTTADGPGFRTSIYLAGCSHHCPGCHNPQSWDASGGNPMTVEEITDRVEANDLPVTITGGDPFFSPENLRPLLEALTHTGRNIWVYTGYTFEQIMADPQRRPLLGFVDVLVDGPFLKDQRDTTLIFRGSPNQRIIDIRRTLRESEIPEPILWESGW